MSTHATLSPSARYRWQLCPASVRECANYPPGKSSASALDGTRTHALLELCIKYNHRADQFVGTVLTDDEGRYTIDINRAERVNVALDYIAQRIDTLPEGTTVLTECWVNPKSLVKRADMTGTVDVLLMNDGFVEIIDYKDGIVPVTAIDNAQCELYVVGVLAGDRPFDRVRMTIIQPKLKLFGKEPISSHERSAEEFFAEIIPKIIEEAKATDDPNAPFVPGEKQCKYCANAGNCSAFQKHGLESAGISFEATSIAKEAALKDSESMTDEQLRDIIESAPLLRKMIEMAEVEALARIQAGHAVSGLKAVKGPGRRQWLLPEDATAEKLTRMGVPKSVVWTTSLISPAQIEKAHWLKRDGSSKQLSSRQLGTVAQDLITKTEGRLTVVPEEDSRPAVNFAPIGEMFKPTELPDWMK